MGKFSSVPWFLNPAVLQLQTCRRCLHGLALQSDLKKLFFQNTCKAHKANFFYFALRYKYQFAF
jgi:hypothetical protein